MPTWIHLNRLDDNDKQKLCDFAQRYFAKHQLPEHKIKMIVDDISSADNGLPMIGTFRKYFPRGTGLVGLYIRPQ